MPALGWYPDPENRHELRFHDGARWTRHIADQGVIELDDVEIDLRDATAREASPSWRSLSIWTEATASPATPVMAGTTGAGWFADPSRRHQLRYYDGSAWSDYVGDADGYRIDPI